MPARFIHVSNKHANKFKNLTNKNFVKITEVKNFRKNLASFLPILTLTLTTVLATTSLRSLPASADTSVDASIKIVASCSLTGTLDEAHTAEVINGQYVSEIGTTTLRTHCNDANGYEIYAIGYSNNESGNTNLIEQPDEGSTDTPNIIATGLYPTGLVQNSTPSSWSMKLTAVSGTYTPNIKNNFDEYHIIPNTSTLVASYSAGTSGKYQTDSSLTTTYDTYASQTQPAGTYQGKVKYTMVQSAALLRIYMKDLTTSTIATLLPTVGSTATVYDKRDDTEYEIARLADGNVWMLDNLALGDAKAIALTPANTNIATNWTLPASDPWAVSYDAAYIAASGTCSTSDYCSYDGPWTKNSLIRSNYSASANYRVGVYYNYCAASAGTICAPSNDQNATYDICPKSWRMPTGGSNGEYQTLYEDYDSDFTTYSTALHLPFSGYYDGITHFQGASGNWWTATVADDLRMHHQNTYDNSIYPATNDVRSYGFAIRCLFNK